MTSIIKIDIIVTCYYGAFIRHVLAQSTSSWVKFAHSRSSNKPVALVMRIPGTKALIRPPHDLDMDLVIKI